MNSEEVISKIGNLLSKLAEFWRYRPDLNWGIKVLQTFALPLGHGTVFEIGAGDEARTRYLHLGKVALYRMSYTRIYYLNNLR